jgi:aminoglycoside phosphotransferase (APT) family kinase protein
MDDVRALDEAALEAYLSHHLDGFAGPLSTEKFAGGQSNPTYLVRTPKANYVLRRKPPGHLLKSAHAIEREYRVMKALADTPVPVPRMLLICEDDHVLGTSFFLMEHVAGCVLWDPALPDETPAARAAVYDEMNAALASLHSVDIAAVGLADFGRPGNYFARQLARWSEQYRASETGTLADMDRLIAWLGAALPDDDGRVALVHGDYRIDNMIFASNEPRLLALLDWELSTLGHPFADLAYQCMQWRLPNEGVFRGLGDLDRAAAGIPTEADYVARYCGRMGLAGIPDWTFCLAFSFFRLAAILQGVKKRVLEGNASNPERGLKMGEAVPVLAGMAMKLIEGKAR